MGVGPGLPNRMRPPSGPLDLIARAPVDFSSIGNSSNDHMAGVVAGTGDPRFPWMEINVAGKTAGDTRSSPNVQLAVCQPWLQGHKRGTTIKSLDRRVEHVEAPRMHEIAWIRKFYGANVLKATIGGKANHGYAGPPRSESPVGFGVRSNREEARTAGPVGSQLRDT